MIKKNLNVYRSGLKAVTRTKESKFQQNERAERNLFATSDQEVRSSF